MPGTPALGLPYPSSADVDDVPADLEALAEALENTLPRGVVSRVRLVGDSDPTSGAAETVVASLPAFNADPARCYKLTLSGEPFCSGSGDQFEIRMRDDTVGGTERTMGYYQSEGIGTPGMVTFTRIDIVDGGWTGPITPVITMKRIDGAGTGSLEAGFVAMVEDIGPA